MAGAKNLKILPGLLILALGVALLLNNFDIVDLGGLKVFWPLALVAFGLHLFFERKSRVFGGVLAAVGVGLQVENLGWADIPWGRIRDFWPLLLIALGASMLLKGSRDNAVLGVILVALGAYYQGEILGWVRFDLIDLWPVAVIAAGVAMLMKARGS